MIGRELGRYRIESKLGEGGMGVVYGALDTALNRHVALKVLAAGRVADPARRERFIQEAQAASALNHPGIVTVHDIASHDGVDFIVMELIEGKTLDHVIGGTGMGVIRALRLGAALADALARAHAAGIVHRDLKPANIILTNDDRVKVLDFGLAKLVAPLDEGDSVGTRAVSLTQTGVLMGTAAYMSPEQISGGVVDPRSDIFSFGGVLYEMVTGRRPFAGDSPVQVLSKILEEEPLPLSRITPVPPEVERVILRCLRKDPARRYQSMADLKVALEDLAADTESGAIAAPVASARATAAVPVRAGWTSGVAVTVALLLAAALAWRLWPTPPADAPLSARPLASLPGITRSPSFSPDGSQVAFTWTGESGTNMDVYVQHVGSGAPLRLTMNPATDNSARWSPDGRWIAFLRLVPGGMQELRLVPPLGGPERKLTDVTPRDALRPISAAWCPDATCLVVTDAVAPGRADALYLVSVESGARRQLTFPPDGVLSDNDPAISPDGAWLAFRRDNAPFAGSITLVRLVDGATSGEPRALTEPGMLAFTPQWTPDSREVLFSAKGALWRQRIDGNGQPERLPFVGEDGITPMLSRPMADGASRLAYVRSYSDTNIWRVDVAAPGALPTAPPVVAISSTRADGLPFVSPDGGHVVFTSTRSGDNEVWRAEVSGSGAVQMTRDGRNPGWPSWAPDGEQIAYHGLGTGASGDIFVVPAEGGTPRNLTDHPATDAFARYAADGRSIYFSSARLGEPSIWKVAVDGGAPVQVTPGIGLMAMESPDGRHVYYTEARDPLTASALWRLPAGGGPPEHLANAIVAGSFTVVQAGIYATQRHAGGTRLLFVNATTLAQTTVIDVIDNAGIGVGATADGRSIFFTKTDAMANDLMLVEGFR